MTSFKVLRQIVNISRGNFHELPPEVEAIIGEIGDRHARAETPHLAPKEVRENKELRACLERLAEIDFLRDDKSSIGDRLELTHRN